MTDIFYAHVDSPVGALLVAGDGVTLHFLSFPDGRKAYKPRSDWRQSDAPFVEVKRQLDAYFGRELYEFDLQFSLSGTPFQNKVWRYLATIPYGETRTYGQLASALGHPNASRAIGAANGSNPLPIILPCHRVIGADGSLTGFGGGLPTKKYLLGLEGGLADNQKQPDLFG